MTLLQGLRELHQQLLQGTAEAEAEAAPADQQCETLENKVSKLQCELEASLRKLAEEKCVSGELKQQLTEQTWKNGAQLAWTICSDR